MPFLSTETFDLGDGEALNAKRRESNSHLVKLERFNNGDDELHVLFLVKKGGDASKAKGVPTFFLTMNSCFEIAKACLGCRWRLKCTV
jgi:hypothetical protein